MSAAHKVVIHLSSQDAEVHKGLIQQLKNLLSALEDVSIEVVTNGPGIYFLLSPSPLASLLERLRNNGVVFLVCRNSLKAKNIEESTLPSYTQVVPAAVAHLVIRQEEGWSYIKAGF